MTQRWGGRSRPSAWVPIPDEWIAQMPTSKETGDGPSEIAGVLRRDTDIVSISSTRRNYRWPTCLSILDRRRADEGEEVRYGGF